MNMDLSIIVLTCNQRAYTMRLLESMGAYLRATPGTELILVDNGSADTTIADVRRWQQSLNLSNLTIIEAGENLGVARGRNLGLKAARGEVLMLLDNDTIADPDTFEALRRHVIENPSCGIAAPALYAPDGELQASAKPYPGIWIKLAHILRPGIELACEREELLKPHPYYVIGACQTFRREIPERIGMLDSAVFFGPEDCEYCIRVRKAGYTIDYLPHLRLTHYWRRATRRSPLSPLARRHAIALLRFWLRHPLP